MRRKIVFLICLIIAGTFSYYGGYRVYQSTHPKEEILQIDKVQKGIRTREQEDISFEEYYVGKIEQNMLVIYKMPEEILYDSMEISSLNFYGTEETELMEGKIFQTLTEVFEFLENSMS